MLTQNSYASIVFILLFMLQVGAAQQKDNAFLNEQFSSYETVKVNSSALLTEISAQRDGQYRLNFLGWNMQLTDSGILDERYQAVAFDGTASRPVPPTKAKALQGYTDQGGRVSITINENFVQGFVRTGMFTYNFEPVYHFDKTADRDLIVIYNSKDIKPGQEKNCGVKSDAKNLSHSDRNKNTGERISGQCREVQYAIATDYSMYAQYGSVTNVENHNIAVTNDMQTNYDDEFADELRFIIVKHFIVVTAGGDPAVWTTTTSPDSLLTNFSTWGPSGFNTTHDVGSLWTRRDFDGSTVGIAWIGQICMSFRYNALQDFTSNATSKRVLLAHEMGHNFSASHDASGSNTIMAPSVNSATTWSGLSVTAIQNHYNSRTCLSQCVNGPPTVSFTVPTSSIEENGGTGSAGSCSEPFKTITIPVSVNKTLTTPITVSVTVNPNGSASNNRDFILLTNTLTFPTGPATTQNIQVRIIDDSVVEMDENFTLQLSVTGGGGTTGSFPTHTVTITDLDALSTTGQSNTVTYGNNNGSTNLIFWGQWDDARTRILYLPSQLSSAGVTAGYITSILFFVSSKGSTQPYQNFRIGMSNVSENNLTGMPWISTQQTYLGTVATVSNSWNEIVLQTPFYWNGSSSIYMEFCFDNSSFTNNDLIIYSNPVGGGTGRYVEAFIQDGTSGCNLTSQNAFTVNYNNFSIQPHFQFKQNIPVSVETLTTATVKSSLKSGELANFYSSSGKVIASIKNIGAQDINCIEASIETAGTGKNALPFGGGDYSAKTIKIDASYNSLYEVTLYYTQAELNTFGANANKLNIIKSQNPLSSATLTSSVINRPDSILPPFGPDNAYGYKATFTGFSRFALTNRNTGTGTTITNGDLVLSDPGKGIIFKNKSGNSILLTATNSNTLSSQSLSAIPPGNTLDKSDLAINSATKNIVLRSANNQYRRLVISDTGALSLTPISLPAVRAELVTGHIILNEGGGALIMNSPNGTCWRVFVNESGQLRTVNTICP